MDEVAGYSSALTPDAVELIPENYFAPLDLAAIFPNRAPVEIDLGCGDGTFLVGLAAQYPGRNFLGIERLLGRVRAASGKAARAKLLNVRVLLIESAYAMQYLLPRSSVAAVHLLFPDPWPKKRHQRRRIVTRDFLGAVHRALAPNGLLRIATDQQDYFEAMRELVSATEFQIERHAEEQTFPLTKFEKRFVAEGLPIYRLRLRKSADQ